MRTKRIWLCGLMVFGMSLAVVQQISANVVITFSDLASWGGGTAGSYNAKTYEEDGWFFESDFAVRESTDLPRIIGTYSWRIRGNIFLALNTSAGSYSGFEIKLRPWSSTEPSNTTAWQVEFSVDNGENWTNVGSIQGTDPLEWTSYGVSFEETEFEANEFQVRLTSSGNPTANDNRINVGEFIALTGSGPENEPPLISLLPSGSSKSVFVGSPITFNVIADQVAADAGQETALTALSIPAGALFAGASGPAPVQSTFDWTPDVVGVYTAIFTAADSDGVTTQEVQISVQGPVTAPEGTLVEFDFGPSTSAGALWPSLIADNLGWSVISLSDSRTITFAAGNPGAAVSGNGWHEENRYWQFTLNVADGYEMSVTELSFDERASATGPQVWALRTSLDDFESDLASAAVLTNAVFDAQTASLNLSGVTGEVVFRIYGSGAGSSAGTWRIDNLILRGAVSDGEGPGPDPEQAEITGFTRSGADFVITFTGEVGATYRLEYTADLTNPDSWIGGPQGSSGSLTDVAPDAPVRFYRLIDLGDN